jgi:hypothetical protein
VRQKIVRVFPETNEMIPNLNEGWLSLDVGPCNAVQIREKKMPSWRANQPVCLFGKPAFLN